MPRLSSVVNRMLHNVTMDWPKRHKSSTSGIVMAVFLTEAVSLVVSPPTVVAADFRKGSTYVANSPKEGAALVAYVKTLPVKFEPRECFPQRFVALPVIDRRVQVEELGRYPSRRLAMQEDRVIVRINRKFGFIDDDGRIVVPALYDQAADFSEGLAVVRNDESFGYVNPAGRLVISPQYDYGYSFCNGLGAVKKGGKWGLIDPKGTWVKSPTYQDLTLLGGGIYAVTKTGERGFVNSRGEIKRSSE